MSTTTPSPEKRRNDKSWRKAVVPYERPDTRRAVVQILNSFLPYFALVFLMYKSLSVSYWITLGLAAIAGGFLVRIFIIAHDCGHGSFFKSRKWNNFIGPIASTLAFTPYGSWKFQHAVHHASSGDLDRRDMGDVWTLTVDEYLAASWKMRFAYRLYRFPIVTFIIGPIFQFFIASRFYRSDATPKEKRSVIKTNLSILAIILVASFTVGFKTYLLIQVPIMAFAGTAGVWLFYVQHQFEGVYWERHPDWEYLPASLQGSSFYKLPKVFQWFSGNIGFHHVHHLSPRIPNYFLPQCHDEQELFKHVTTITLKTGFRSLRLRLWDEERKEMISFGQLRKPQNA